MARKETVAFVKKLINDYNIPEEVIEIYFSGMKGFSVTIDYAVFNAEASADLPLIWKSVTQELAAKLKLKTIDLRIYERRRLWRLPNSRHQKTGLYKHPMTLLQLEKVKVESIRVIADMPMEPFAKSESEIVPKAEKLFLEHKAKVEAWTSERKKTFDAPELKNQISDPPCIKRLLETGAQKGERNNFTFQLALYYAKKGISQNENEERCIQFANKTEDPLTEREVHIIVASAVKGVAEERYNVGCSSEALADSCDKDSCSLVNSEAHSWPNIGEPISFEEWQKTINANFPLLWPYAEACASTVAVLLIQDTQPLALVLQGAPSGGKTTTLDFFKGFPYSHSTDKFTPRSFVSHVAQKSEAELKKIDMLPRIKGRVLITPDLTTLFGAKADELKETFSILTRVLDGRGLTIDSGVYGARGYEGDYMFTWIGATTPIPHSVWDLFGNLGARMYFMQVIKKAKSNENYIADLKQKNYRKKVDECNQATLRFLKGIWREERLEWNSVGDKDSEISRIVQLAKLVTKLRGKINVVVKEDYGRKETFYSEPIIEEPDRCIQALYSLMRGHALIQGRTQIDTPDLPVIIDVALSSAPWDRVNAFAYLLTKDVASTNDLIVDLKCSRSKAIRTMKTLELLELVSLEEEAIETYGGEQTGYAMKLKDEFSWFKSNEFKQLWRLKVCHSEHQTNNQAQTSNAAKLETWQSFLEESTDNGPENAPRSNTEQEG